MPQPDEFLSPSPPALFDNFHEKRTTGQVKVLRMARIHRIFRPLKLIRRLFK